MHLNRALFLVVLATGCNGILGIPQTHEGLDGGTADAPKDLADARPKPDSVPGTPDASVLDGASRDACASQTYAASLAPLDIFIMLDKSASMTDPVGGGDAGPQTTKWDAVKAALDAFVTQSSSGLSVGLGYFGVPGPTCSVASCTGDADCLAGGAQCGTTCLFNICSGFGSSDSCDSNDYAKPAVEIAPLPGNASPIESSIAATNPETATPTSAALDGALSHARTWSQSHVSHTVAVILATDGNPTECDTMIPDIRTIAASYDTGAQPIPTFVIGVGDLQANLDQIAAGGGTGHAYIVDTTGDVNAQFLTALNGIRGQAAIGCKYTIPLPTSGTPDFSALSVEYNGASLAHHPDQASCGAGGWYYDDSTSPTEIILCGATCDTVETDPSASINVVYPCN